MQFTRDPVQNVTVRHIDRDRLTIGDKDFAHTIAITAKDIIDDWNPIGVAELNVSLLQPLLDRQPDVVIIGTGWSTERPPRELTFAMARLGIGLEVMTTPAACRTFNILIAEDRQPAAILYMD